MLPDPVPPLSAVNAMLVQGGSLALHWYVFTWIAGIVQGRFYARAMIRDASLWRMPVPLSVGDFDAFILCAVAGAILGGLIGHAVIYGPVHVAVQPAEIAALWKGGLSFHGGLLGVAVAAVWYARRRGISFRALGDVTCAAYPIAHFFGWIAHMVSGAYPGRESDVPWASWFPSEGPLPRHPSQLYEAVLEGLVLLFVLAIIVRLGALKRPGLVMGAFALGHGIIRSACELFREPDPPIGFLWGGLTMGMLLSAALMVAGAGLIWSAFARPPVA